MHARTHAQLFMYVLGCVHAIRSGLCTSSYSWTQREARARALFDVLKNVLMGTAASADRQDRGKFSHVSEAMTKLTSKHRGVITQDAEGEACA